MHMIPFEVGQPYTRRQIYNILGGDLVSNLPRAAGQVLYCCVAQASNPHAPEIILVPNEHRMVEAARQLASQAEPVPVFMRTSPKRDGPLLYQGEFVVEHYAEDRHEVEPYTRKAHRPEVRTALFLRRVR